MPMSNSVTFKGQILDGLYNRVEFSFFVLIAALDEVVISGCNKQSYSAIERATC